MENNRILVFSPHADDATIFVGGTLAKLAAQGKEIYIARVTNDDFDSYGTDAASTIERNREESQAAYSAIGAAETIHMGFKSDYMMMNDYGKLRRDIVGLIRKIRPYTLFTFDLAMKNESNMDHDIIAKAVHEALWISSFDLHYPDQIQAGLLPYSVPEVVLFSTAPDESYEPSDISEVIEAKINALRCHKTPVNNMLQHALLAARCAGLPTQELEQITAMPRDSVIDMFARKLASTIGEAFNLSAAEMIKVCPPSLGIFGGD